MFQWRSETERLTDLYFGPLYPNYSATRSVLVRQARDLLVCHYHGNAPRFETEFCVPAAALMAELLDRAVIEVSCTKKHFLVILTVRYSLTKYCIFHLLQEKSSRLVSVTALMATKVNVKFNY